MREMAIGSYVPFAQYYLTLWDPMDCSPPGSSVYGISQAKILEWAAASSPGDLPDPGIEPITRTLQAESLLLSHMGNPYLSHVLTYSVMSDYSRPHGI